MRSRRLVVPLLALLMGGATLLSSPNVAGAQAPEKGNLVAPSKVLPRPMKVAAALRYLGAEANQVAASRGLTLGRWREVATDSTAWIDRTGALFHIDPVPNKSGKSQKAKTRGATAEPAPFPYAETFLLHSNPTATRKIFLDFNGHAISGTAWGSGAALTAPAYSLDADANTFSNAELDAIQDAWQRVAEDYAPFDVDVTTEDPGYAGINRSSTSDTSFGTRLVVTSNTSSVYPVVCPGGCGGVAYVGTIDTTGATHDFYQPAWVFTTSGKNIAEAASHEAGHNLGLSHDGTSTLGYYRGHGAWAPIMGVGYDHPVSQWSRGEYTGANNTQDDFVVAGQNAIPLRGDDFGGVASPSSVSSPVNTSGVIHSATDVDAFQFGTSGGLVSFAANPASVGANLDIQLRILDNTGAVVANDDPPVAQINPGTAAGLSATVSATLPAGTYRVVVDGVGFGSPLDTGYSDYGSLGAYTLTGTFATGNQSPLAVATASPTSGVAPLTVNYNGAGSSDPDGTIAAYAWSFSDGSSSTAVNPTKVWSAGTHTATLVVTDNSGASSNPVTVTVNVTEAVNIKVQSLSMAITLSGGRRQAATTVTVTDQTGAPVSGVTVTGSYTGLGAVTRTGTTGASGTVTLLSTRVRNSTGTFTFTIGSLSKSGTTYNAGDNLVSSISRSF
jgi:hypothetical protein